MRVLNAFRRVCSKYIVYKLFNTSMILLYHRVADLESDPQLLSVSMDNFREQMQFLKTRFTLLSLSELPERIKDRSVPDNSVVITFDDGYADNLYNAKPVLQEFNIPATVFVTSEMIGTKREFWWDDLERMILLAESLPECLTLKINDRLYSWDIGESTDDRFHAEKYREWDVTMADSPTARHVVYRELCDLVRPVDHMARKRILDEVSDWADLKGRSRTDYRPMSSEEIRALAEGGLIEVGGHTQSHPVLSALTHEEQVWEIQRNKRELEAILGRPVTIFSYPYGGRSDYNAESVAVVREAGFTCACSNFEGQVGWWTDRFQLPRFLIRNWNGDEFARRMKRFHG